MHFDSSRQFIPYTDLRVDPYFKQILREVGSTDVEEIEMLPDATWKLKVETGESARKKVKTEVGELSVDIESKNTDPPAEAIDLTLSSDDEEQKISPNIIPDMSPAVSPPSEVLDSIALFRGDIL